MPEKNTKSRSQMAEQRNFEQLKTDLVMSALAIISISIGLHEISNPDSDIGMTLFDWVDLGIVTIFIIEFAWYLTKAGKGHRWSAIKKRWWELPSLLPITGGMFGSADGAALLRGVRIFRLVRVVRLLRIVSVALRFKRMSKDLIRIYREAYIGALITAGITIILLGAAGIFAAESQDQARFKAFDECIWWSLNMFTNVAYVDFHPITGLGRIVAGILQLMGMAFIGIFGACLVKALIKETKQSDSEMKEEISFDKD